MFNYFIEYTINYIKVRFFMLSKFKTVDLCAGIGGIRKGFELTKCTVNVLSAENDKFACKTYQHLYNENPMNDITTEEFKESIKKTDYDILLAGFPCQSFSAVGKREGFKDILRGTIFFHIAEMIESTRPKAFLLENVEGLIIFFFVSSIFAKENNTDDIRD